MHNLISPNVLGALLCCVAIVANVYYSIIIAKKFRLEHRYIRLSICLICNALLLISCIVGLINILDY